MKLADDSHYLPRNSTAIDDEVIVEISIASWRSRECQSIIDMFRGGATDGS